MNNYLLQILKETKTIIIPGLGALTVTNEATGEIMFMSFLKHDDGNLAKYISEKEGMDINDAKNMIAKFVREVMIELDKGETYDMYQFGKFQKVAGEIEFDQWSASSAPSEATKAEEPLVTEETPVAIPEAFAESTATITEEPTIEPEPVVETPAPVKEPEVEIPAPFVEEVKEEPAPVAEAPKAEEPKKEEPSKVEETPIPIPVPFAEEVKEETPVQENSKTEAPREEIPPVIVPESGIEPDPIKEIHPEQAIPPAPKTKETEKKDLRKPVGKSPKEKLKEADKNKGEQSKKKKTGALGYILWGIVVLVLGAGTYVAVQFDTLKKDFPILADLAGENEPTADTTSLKTIGETDPSAHPDSMPKAEPIPGSENVTEEVTEPEPIVEEKKAEPKPEPKPVAKPKPAPKKTEPVAKPIPKPQPKPVSRPQTVSVYKPKPANFPTPNMSKPYHIIAGSFSSNTNARNFATKLKNIGMSNLSIGEKDGLYKVSINGYDTEEEAKKAAAGVQNVAPGAWVFKWN